MTVLRRSTPRAKPLFAVLGELTEIKTHGDHGRVLITYKFPANMKYMDVIRVEIFRGAEANKIDTQTPYDSWVYLDEDKEVVEAPPAAAAETTPAREPAGKRRKAQAKGATARRRRRRRKRRDKRAAPDKDRRRPLNCRRNCKKCGCTPTRMWMKRKLIITACA